MYDGVDMVIERGARVALVGPNGAGKSTMMRLLAGVDALTAGERIVGHNVSDRLLCAGSRARRSIIDKTVLEELSDNCARDDHATRFAACSARCCFRATTSCKRAGVLSGGERARLALAKVLAHRNNCLLLDEPTNNLDIIAKETLLEALRRYHGTVVIVSHDRYILNELVTEVIEVGQGHATRYLGNYDEYLAKKEQMAGHRRPRRRWFKRPSASRRGRRITTGRCGPRSIANCSGGWSATRSIGASWKNESRRWRPSAPSSAKK